MQVTRSLEEDIVREYIQGCRQRVRAGSRTEARLVREPGEIGRREEPEVSHHKYLHLDSTESAAGTGREKEERRIGINAGNNSIEGSIYNAM